MPRAKPVCVRVCRECGAPARSDDRFCSDRCEDRAFYRKHERAGERETVQQQGDTHRAWLNGGTQRANLQNSA